VRIVVAGALANKRGYGGEAWVRLAWVRGLQMLGADVLFLEQLDVPAGGAEAETSEDGDPRIRFFERVTSSWGLDGQAALVTPRGERLSGLPAEQVVDFANGADLLVNLSGHLTIPAVMQGVRRRAYVDLDPGYTQFWLANGREGLGLEDHDVHFTVGVNIGAAGCSVPTSGFDWLPMRQPVLLDEWPVWDPPTILRFSTVATWRGAHRPVEFAGRRFGPKAHEFRRFARLPAVVPVPLEVALNIAPEDAADLRLLKRAGWIVTDPAAVAGDPEAFRDYVRRGSAELTVAQSIFASTKCGWFSDRSARYLATGRPVIVQDTGIGLTLPVGEGLFTFRTVSEAESAARDILRNYPGHRSAARQIAEEYFEARAVLGGFLERAIRGGEPKGDRPGTMTGRDSTLAKPGQPPLWRRSTRRGGTRPGRVVVGGMLAGAPGQGGATWSVLQYVLGFARLGWDVHLVDELKEGERRPAGGSLERSDNARYFRAVCRQFGLDGKAMLISGDEVVGGSRRELETVAEEAELLFNLSGRLCDRALLDRMPTRVYVDLEPGFTQMWREHEGMDLGLDQHTHHVTVGLEVGRSRCPVPTGAYGWIPTLPPVVLSEWATGGPAERDAWTTVANWTGHGSIRRDGVHYGQRAHAFRALLPLPQRTGDRFEVALAIHPQERADLEALEGHGWTLLDPGRAAGSPDAYRRFILGSAAEVGVAKTGYVASRCGWFSDRSACYLAAGRPVLAQDTGFSMHLPVGQGLVTFDTLDQAVDGVAAVRRDYSGHSLAARRIAEEHLDSDRVLTRLLREVGVS